MQVTLDYYKNGKERISIIEESLSVCIVNEDKFRRLIKESGEHISTIKKRTGVSLEGLGAINPKTRLSRNYTLRDVVALASFFKLTRSEFCERVDLKVWRLSNGEMVRYI